MAEQDHSTATPLRGKSISLGFAAVLCSAADLSIPGLLLISLRSHGSRSQRKEKPGLKNKDPPERVLAERQNDTKICSCTAS